MNKKPDRAQMKFIDLAIDDIFFLRDIAWCPWTKQTETVARALGGVVDVVFLPDEEIWVEVVR